RVETQTPGPKRRFPSQVCSMPLWEGAVMDIAIKSKAIVALAVALLPLALAGCDSSAPAQRPGAGEVSLDPRPVDWYLAQPGVLRAKVDEARARVWTLSEEGVDLFDARSDAKLRSISLPEWIWAREFHSCPPDLAIAPGGD